jgi:hypothetical protein
VVLVDGEAQVQQLQLAVVSVQQVSPRSAVLARAPHVLAQPVQRRALLGVALRVVAVRGADVALERLDPVDLVGLLQRHGDHGDEGRHGAVSAARPAQSDSRERVGRAVGAIEDAVSNCDGRPRRVVCAGVVARGGRGGRCRAVRGGELEATVAVLCCSEAAVGRVDAR